jgi:hypothetical protein
MKIFYQMHLIITFKLPFFNFRFIKVAFKTFKQFLNVIIKRLMVQNHEKKFVVIILDIVFKVKRNSLIRVIIL